MKFVKRQKSIIQFVRDRFNKVSLIVLVISIGIVNFFVFLPYLKWELLIGWDTPIYMYFIFYVEKYGVAATFMSGVIDKPLFALILCVFSKLGASPEQLLKVTPMMFSSLYIISVYLLLREGSNDSFLASLAALFSSCAYATLRLANEVQPHLLALGCMMIGMFFHLKYVNNGDKRYVIFSIVISLFILGIHPLAYGTYIAILVFSYLMARGKKSQKCKREMINTIACILPLVGVMLFLLFTSLTPVATLAEGLLNPRVVSQATSHRKLMYDLTLSIPLLIFSIVGIAILLRSRGGIFTRMLLAWTASFSLALLLCASLGATFANRFIVTLPLPILVAYGYRGWPKKAHLKSLILIAVMVANLSIATQYQLSVKPWIDKELRDELVWVKENLGDKLIIPICPLNWGKGYWVLGIVGDYIYYGEVLPLLAKKQKNYSGYPGLDTNLYWKRLEDAGVFKNLAEYKIVLVSGVYALSIVDEQITEKVENHDIYIVNHSVLTNETKIDDYYQIWRKFKDAKIAVIGQDWWETKEILYELWIPPIPAGIVIPPNIEYLGTTGLPALENSNKYDILILADWNVAQNKTEAERLLEYFKEGCAIVATSQSVYELYNASSQTVEFIFGIGKAYLPDALYSNITYSHQHYVTSNFSVPFNSTGAEYGFPVSNLNMTTAQGIATVTSSEQLYLLVANQRNDTRAAHFGLELSEMSENDVVIFKRLLLWTLHLEACLK
ncbi:MAG TPA: hypothetical protein HA348_06030 [Thermoplasmata archaeon]|nr:hypothetical protein [Thermoplasmata archaeon]